jgi:two-component system repressor protein LuxO
MLLDMRLPDMEGMDILREVAGRATPMTVIVMTAHGSVDLAVEAMRQGAYDFLTKPLDFERLKVMVRNAVERHTIIAELDNYRNQYERTRFRGLVGSSPAMQRLYRQLRSVGAGASPVLVVGPPGSEVDECARAVHDESPRAGAPFVVARAALLGAAQLAEQVQAAQAGTVYISEAHRLGAEAATALLDYLRSGQVGGRAGSARVVAGGDPSIDSGAIPAELKLALEVARIQVPPLADRGEDVLDMAEQLVAVLSRELGRSFTGLDDAAQVAVVNYKWPGNRAELDAAIRGALQKHEGRLVTVDMLPPAVAACAAGEGAARADGLLRGLAASGTVRPLWQVEREEIEKALKICEGNVLHAARLLEISPATIYRKQQVWKARQA